MRVLLDEQPCGVANAANVNDAISGAAAVARTRGRVIVDVFVDGERWGEEQLGAPDAASAAAEEVRLFSAHPGELVRQTLVEAAAALAQADALQREAAELMQADKRQPAMHKLGEAITIWRTVQEAVSGGSELIGLNLDTVTCRGRAAQQTVARLGEQLVSLRNALAAGDSISVADTLLYELPEVVEEWRDLLDHIQQLAGQPTTPDSRSAAGPEKTS